MVLMHHNLGGTTEMLSLRPIFGVLAFFICRNHNLYVFFKGDFYMKWTGLNELRDEFLSFFESKAHTRLKSYPLLPQGDNSLLLINSGMAPMKKFFLGQQTPPNKRVTTCQKCVRTPDIERVGKTSRHGTYFEMLGNFSFGDYFKVEAIKWAWEFITEKMEIPVDKLWVSVYLEDDEARDIWIKETGISADRIVKLGKEDNFWEIGAGPSGPCSEIYFDRGEENGCDSPTCAVGCDCDRYVEFWNLVFSQFDNDGNGNYTLLENPNIDTGMGLERLACIMQGVNNLFEVDTVQNIMKHICEIANVEYKKDEKTDVSLRVITDHIRSTTFLIGDGVTASNEGRGYVLRRLLRRAARHGRLLGVNKPFLFEVVKTVAKENETAYPELMEKLDFIVKSVKVEEDNFNKTIGKGSEILNDMIETLIKSSKTVLSGEDAFKLYDTYGFPIDLTREIVAEKNITIDEEVFDTLMAEQRKRARDARLSMDSVGWVEQELDLGGVTPEFVGYSELECKAKVLAIIVDGQQVHSATNEQTATIVFDNTPFYAEGGGQAADKGCVTNDNFNAEVIDVQKTQTGITIHACDIKSGQISVGDEVSLVLTKLNRQATMKNHTAAHLIQAALRNVLGDHVHQAGQLVNGNLMRFDFSHFEAMTAEEIAQVETQVNEKIMEAIDVSVKEMSIDEAKEAGAMALFSEKYGDVVRVVSVGDYSMELCGGTHVDNTAKIGLFKIVSESSIASGVRRIEAKTGMEILSLLNNTNSTLLQAAASLKLSNPTDIVKKCDNLVQELKDKNSEIQRLNTVIANTQISGLRDNAKEVKGIKIFSVLVSDANMDALRAMGDRAKEKAADEAAIIMLVSMSQAKSNFLCICTQEAVKSGAHAGKIVKEAAMITGSNGGGRPDNAMAGVGDNTKIDEALLKLPEIVENLLSSK